MQGGKEVETVGKDVEMQGRQDFAQYAKRQKGCILVVCDPFTNKAGC